MKIITIPLLCILIIQGSCAFERLVVGAEPIGLGNSIVAYPHSAYALYYNQANLVYHRNSKITLNYRTFYGISELIQADVSGIHWIAGMPVGWGLHHYGNELYHETQALLSSSWSFSKTTSIGIGVSFYALSITGYGESYSWGVHVSVTTQIADRLYWGAMISNINQPTIGESRESLPQSLDIGICYSIAQDLFFTTDIYKETRFKPDFRAGIGYRLNPIIALRGGIEDKVETFTMGFGLKLTKFNFDYAIMVHPELNASHAISVLVDL